MAEDYSRLDRRLNGFNIYAREARKNILQSDPSKGFAEIARLVGENWKTLDKETKSLYNERASVHNEQVKQLEQAKQLMSKQCKQKPQTATNNLESTSSTTAKPKPRRISGYLIFAQEVGREIMSNDPSKQFCDITSIVASQWQLLTTEMKRKYYEQASIYNSKPRERKSEPAKEEPLPSVKGALPANKEVITFALLPKKKKKPVLTLEDCSGKYWTKTDNCILIDEPERPDKSDQARTGFMIYSSEIREQVVKRNKLKDSDTIDKLIVRRWKKLPVIEKLAYHQRALNYNKDMREHSEQQQKKVVPPKRKKVVKKVTADSTKIKKKRGRPPKVREPRTAARHISGFVVYSAEVRQQFKDAYPNQSFGFLSKLIGDHWKALPEDTKSFYRQKARVLNQEYNRAATQTDSNELSV